MNLFRFRSASSDHFCDDLDKAIFERRFWAHPCDQQNDYFESLPFYKKSWSSEVKGYLSHVESDFGPLMHYSGFNGQLWMFEIDSYPYQSVFLQWISFFRDWSMINFRGDSSEIEAITFRELPDGSFEDVPEAGRPVNQAEFIAGFLKLECGESDVAAMNAIRYCWPAFRYLRNSFKISCFSEGNSSKLMWGHYTQGSKGVCLEFELSNEANPNCETSIHKVSYIDERPEVTTVEIMKYFGEKLELLRPGFNEGYSRTFTEEKITRTKDREWSYEDEWRLLHFTTGPAGYVHFEQLKPTRMYLGFGLSQMQRDQLNDRYGTAIEILLQPT